jgi:hypothetical protein
MDGLSILSARFIVDPDIVDFLLRPNIIDNLINFIPGVGHHGIVSAQLDRIGQSIGTDNNIFHHPIFLISNIKISPCK